MHRPNRVKRLGGVIGWVIASVLLLAGAMFIPLSFSDWLDPGDNWPMRICGIVSFLAGLVLVAIYITWRVPINDEKIVLRTLFRKVMSIRFADIERHVPCRNCFLPILKLWGTDGTVIQLNSGALDTNPVRDAIKQRPSNGDGPDCATFRNRPEPAPQARPGPPVNHPTPRPRRHG